MAVWQDYWPAIGLALVIGLLVAWWLWGRSRPGAGQRVRSHAPDVLDEGAAPARRNQALIDAPSATAAALAGAGPGAATGAGEMIAAAADQALLTPQEKLQVAAETEAEITGMPAAAVPEVAVGPAEPGQEPDTEGGAEAGLADDLTRIKGVGPKLSARLRELGIETFAAIAGWDEADLARIDGQLGAFAGRPARDGWVEQCRFLAMGDVAGYEAKFGKL
jgi:predicted flap endonuclease-1-like 5' DNA nuclease